jgi:hypothetical protein
MSGKIPFPRTGKIVYFCYVITLGKDAMKWAPAIALVGAFITQLPAASIADDATELPMRKAGRWELKTVMNEGGGMHEQTLTMCVDGEMERNTVAASAVEHKQSCSKYAIAKSGDTFTVDANCHLNERDVESRTEMSGDFQTAFKVKIESTTSGIDGGQSISVKRTITQEGKYLGDACGDLKAGEAMGADGSKIMVQ